MKTKELVGLVSKVSYGYPQQPLVTVTPTDGGRDFEYYWKSRAAVPDVVVGDRFEATHGVARNEALSVRINGIEHLERPRQGEAAKPRLRTWAEIDAAHRACGADNGNQLPRSSNQADRDRSP